MPLFNEINFVANQDNIVYRFGRAVISEFLNGGLKTIESIPLSEIKHSHCPLAVAIVTFSHSVKLFLAGGVPYVNSHQGIVNLKSDYFEVDSHSV